MLKNSIIEAIEEFTQDEELAFKVFNLVKFQRFTEMEEVDLDLNILKERELIK